MATTKFRIRLS